jgi:hypothetical protein
MLSDALADLILIVHFLFVLFVVGGFALILTGVKLGWQWVRNFNFRILHLAAIVFVALESLAGVMCPLTLWEDALRGGNSPVGFIQRWVQRVMFYSLPEWVFSLVYVTFALLVAITLWRYPPERGRK